MRQHIEKLQSNSRELSRLIQNILFTPQHMEHIKGIESDEEVNTVLQTDIFQTDPNVKVNVTGVLEYMKVEKDKYYLVFFRVNNSTSNGNDYRIDMKAT